MQEVNLQEIQDKLYEKLKVSGWGPATVNFVASSDFLSILKTLLKESQDGKRFTPQVKNLFRAFEECPYDNLKVIIIGQDPYPGIGIADGIAFSCSNTGRIEKSLEYMIQSIKDTVDPNYEGDADLKHWSNQGVLLLNCALTVTNNKPGAHQLLWKPFTTQLLDYLIWNKQGLIYVFLGKKAAEYADLIPDNHYKLILSHPASAGYNQEETWDCGDMWNKINEELTKNNLENVSW